MKLSLLLSTALLATGISAAPKGKGAAAFEKRQASRAGRTGTPVQRVDKPASGNETDVDYSTNWTGGVLTAPPSGQTFNAVSASFVVPQPSVPSGKSSGTYSASAWVGIDGDTYQNAIWQSGIDVTVTKSGSSLSYSYDAWYEWYPDYAYDFSGITLTAGNTISVSLTTSSSTTGSVVLENVSTGETVTKTITSSSALGGKNAEWIVEDYEENGSLVALADWGTVTFTDAVATGSGGTSEGPSTADVIDLESSSGSILSSVSVSSSEVVVTYV
jgi:hypothetical protein